MEPTLAHISSFWVSGLAARTSNPSEANPLTAKIPALWGNFLSQHIANKVVGRSAETIVYGIYSDYESDVTGYYTVTAGVRIDANLEQPAELHCLQIQAGDYLAFKAQGIAPLSVIQTWAFIWSYFNQHPEIKRRYGTDFEMYNDPHDTTIYIGVNPQ